MRNAPNLRAEKYRILGPPRTNSGAFLVPSPCAATNRLRVIAADGLGWDHVSVSVDGVSRCPHWEEMCAVKQLFFRDDEVVMQLHPAEADYVNDHPYVLHLWRPQTPAEMDVIRREWE